MSFEFCFLLSVPVVYTAKLIYDRRVDAKWARAAKELGLEFQSSAWFKQSCISGRLGSFEIVILRGQHHKMTSAQLTVNGEERIDPRTLMHASGHRPGVLQQLIGEKIVVGDSAFDARLHIEGDNTRVCAVLNHQTRQVVFDFLEQYAAWVSSGMVHVELGLNADSDRVVAVSRAAVHVATQLVLPAEAVAQALAANALADPVPEVRLRNQECLVRLMSKFSLTALRAVRSEDYPLSDVVLRCAEAAESDSDPYQRLLGAIVMGGQRGLIGLQGIVEDRAAPETVRCCALVTLVGRSNWTSVAPTILSALSSNAEPLLVVAVWAIGLARDAQMLDRVSELAVGASDALAIAVAQTLKLIDRTESEPTLIALLDHSADEVRVLAAEALSSVGTTRAVEPLLRISDGPSSSYFKSTAHSAIRSIHGRLGDVQAGQLSLLDPVVSMGALSLATEQGGLSLASSEQDRGSLHVVDQVRAKS